MRCPFSLALLNALSIGALSTSYSTAADGTLKVYIHEAIANAKGEDDKPFGPEQDFYAINGIDYGPPHVTRVIDGRDYASWGDSEVNVKVVPGRNQRYFDLYFELWDLDPHDFGNVDDGFDISPQSGPAGPLAPGGIYVPNFVTGSNPHVDYDVCTGQMLVKGVNGSAWIPVGSHSADLKGIGSSPGITNTWATLRITVVPDPPNWLPDDIMVREVQIIQSIYDQNRAVADKATSLSIKVNSTYPFAIYAPLTGHLDDGINSVQDTKQVWIMPGDNQYYLFDGNPDAPPFYPYKPTVIPGPGVGVVHGWARVDYTETVSPNAPLALQDCAQINNTGLANDLPLERMSDLYTVYAPFDYDEDMTFITSGQLQALFDRDEKFRLASWPLAALNHATSFNQLHRDHGSNVLCPFEPFCTLVTYNIGAAQAGIDRLVLSVRQGWFAQNAFRHQWIGSGSIGYSLGWFARHAVLAEDGHDAVAVHELGHSYDLSQHQCSNAGIFGTCADEYNHPASDGAPYAARGFDVLGQVFPNGLHEDPADWRPTLACPTGAPVGRDICAPNLMDLNCSDHYCNWVDSLTFHYLMDQLPHIDPMVVNVSGLLHLPSGFGGPGSPPPVVEGMMPFYSYQHTGNEDLAQAPLSETGEAYSGFGPFWIRLVRPGGVRDYRFTPRFFDNAPMPDMAAGFSIDLPWDPMTTKIQLIGLVDPRDGDCRSAACSTASTVLAERAVTPRPPTISDLRAGLDVVPPPTPPGGTPPAPIVGPGHDAVLTWNSSDADSAEIHALILVMRQGTSGGPAGPPMPLAVDIAGNTLRIPHDRLMNEPGSYLVHAFVSDGVNTAELDSTGPVWEVCNYINGGFELCNGVDDNCDGTIDNGSAPGPIIDVTLNPQPFPPAPVLQWTADANAQSYDAVYGDLSALTSGSGNFSGAILGCLAENATSTSSGTGPVPAPGQALFFLVRGNNCIGAGTWNESQPGPISIDRDPGINGSTAACRP